MIKLKNILNESWTVKDGNVLSNDKLIGYYDFDRDSDSFWVDDVKKGKGQLSFDTKKEVEDYFKKNEKDAVKHLQKLRESVNESSTPSDIIKDLDKVRTDLIKKVDVLIAKKKKLYSDVDITTPMSADEKQLDKDIQSIFSQIQQIIQQKRSIKEGVEGDTIKCAECGWDWDLEDGGEEPYVCHKCGYDNSDEYDELDVEDDDEEDFLNYLKGYTSELKEANCNCVLEAEYQGREVKLGKPMQGDVKKFKVYVKNPKTGKVIKVNFGQKGMVIKKDNPAARKSFRARMNCDNPGPRTKANYWSCRKW